MELLTRDKYRATLSPLIERLSHLVPGETIAVSVEAGVSGSIEYGLVTVTDRQIFFASLQEVLLHRDPLIIKIPLETVGALRLPVASQKWGNDDRRPYGSVTVYATGGRFKFSGLPSPAAARAVANAITFSSTTRVPWWVRLRRLEDGILDWLWRWIYA